MSASPDRNPFAPPTARVEDISISGIELGGRGQRLVAVIVDGSIQGGVYWLLASTGRGVGSVVVSLVVNIVLFLLIQGYLLATSGQTIGKKLLGLRIVRSNGERGDAGRVIGLRYLICVLASIPVVGWIFVLIDALMIFRDSRKCLHDNVADTIVVRA